MTIIAAWIVSAISSTGYLGLMALMAIESACIPLPSEIIMPFAGYLVSAGRFSLFPAAFAGALGCNLGSTIAYFAGAWGGRPFVERWGRLVLMTPHDLDKAEHFFRRFGAPAVLIARVLPVVRTFIALPAGMARMRQLPFQLYTFGGSFVWCLALAYIGEQLGARWSSDPRLPALMHKLDFAIAGLALLGAGWFVWSRIRAQRRG